MATVTTRLQRLRTYSFEALDEVIVLRPVHRRCKSERRTSEQIGRIGGVMFGANLGNTRKTRSKSISIPAPRVRPKKMSNTSSTIRTRDPVVTKNGTKTAKSKPSVSKVTATTTTTLLISKIDSLLQFHYLSMGNTYDYDHKFKLYCAAHKIDDKQLNHELQQSEYNDAMQCVLFDHQFPLHGTLDAGTKLKRIFGILRYCAAYTPSLPPSVIQGYKLSWNDVYNLFEHDETCISSSNATHIAHIVRQTIAAIVSPTNNNIIDEATVQRILDKLETVHKFSTQQVQDVRRCFLKSKLFSHFGEYPSFHVTQQYSLEQDIFDVHRALLFHRHPQPSANCTLMLNVEPNRYVGPRFNFDPYFVICDDMHEVAQCLLAAAQFVTHVQFECKHLQQLNVELIVIPQRVECVLNENIAFPLQHTIGYIDKYLLRNGCTTYQKISVSKKTVIDSQQLFNIVCDLFAQCCLCTDSASTEMQNIVLIVDRRSTHKCIVYFALYAPDTFKFDALRRSYCLGMSFYTAAIVDRNQSYRTRCYLRYAVDEMMRFFPRHLRWVLPRLFKRTACDDTETLNYDAFGVSLLDPSFDEMYKRCTGTTAVVSDETHAMDVDTKAKTLVDALMTKSDKIRNIAHFSKSLGFKIDAELWQNKQFLNCLHPNLFKPTALSGCRVFDRLLHELKIPLNQLRVTFPYTHAVDHLLSVLQQRDGIIDDKNAFYAQLGMQVDIKWLFRLAKHPTLYQWSAYAQTRVVDRLIDELQFAQLAKHTRYARALLSTTLQYSVFQALCYCVMQIDMDEHADDAHMRHHFAESRFRIEYIFGMDDDDEDEDEKTKTVTFNFDHEFLFVADCKYKLYVQNKSLFKHRDWILFHRDTVNLSEFCYTELANEIRFDAERGVLTLQKDNIPHKYLDEIMDAKWVCHSGSGRKSQTLQFDRERFCICLPKYKNNIDSNAYYDMYARSDLCLHFKLVTSFGKHDSLRIDTVYDDKAMLMFNSFSIHATLSARAWCFADTTGGIIRIYCHSTLMISKEGVIDAVSTGYRASSHDSHLDADECYGGTFATKGQAYSDEQRLSTATCYGEKRLQNLYFGSASSYDVDSGEGCDARGGGIIELIAPKIINYGCLNAGATMGGSGGSIKIRCKYLVNYGHILAKGGVKSFIFNIGQGGDGRIAIYFENAMINKGVILPKPYVKQTRFADNASNAQQLFTSISHHILVD